MPKFDNYTVLIYSSNMQDVRAISKQISKKEHILAIDMYQKRRKNNHNITYITSGMNNLLKLVQRFHIIGVPSIFRIKKVKKEKYKQDSMIKIVE